MRWYSVKKYRPHSHSGRLLVASSNGNIDIAIVDSYPNRYWFEDLEQRELPLVTHFAIIEPVEIEE